MPRRRPPAAHAPKFLPQPLASGRYNGRRAKAGAPVHPTGCPSGRTADPHQGHPDQAPAGRYVARNVLKVLRTACRHKTNSSGCQPRRWPARLARLIACGP